ncbi:MAG: hypothetical protein AB8G23_21440 [Myxococcota bacterium]
MFVDRPAILIAALCAALLTQGCLGIHGRHEIQSDNWDQVLRSEESQVKVRNAQSRVFDTTDRRGMLQALVVTFQDLGFQIEVLDPELGLISGKRYLSAERPGGRDLASYLLYDEESLVVFNRVYRSWGPFAARADMVRLTATVRARNQEQLIVRASAQYYLRPVENPEAYQQFFSMLNQALFTEYAASEPPSDADNDGPQAAEAGAAGAAAAVGSDSLP